ncbi:proline dehydrogenase family protein [Paenibacillus aurantius]|uniref:proline dehydrogenase n=1 Tax=Paenibacillus aurantius TaxID=2918900 RepID=A0AA96RFL2_9BACL|nr:proline dehydrogenase family protein [Paenibacillus aurantius]WNQ12132.1 proline dehydrogenase family protein [Paenibacillus aurantius]
MDWTTKLFRSLLLALAGNRAAEALALKYGLRLGADKFVAGETRAEALRTVKQLNANGLLATIDHLGEGIRHLSEAEAFRDEYLALLEDISQEEAKANVSLKPTQMGLALDPEAGYRNIREIVDKARALGNFVRLDMEDSRYTDATLQVARRLHAEGMGNVGVVIQAYLYRSEYDIRRLSSEKGNVRLVKGAYKEPKDKAYPKMSEVDIQFKRLIKRRLLSGLYTGIATHDEPIIEWTKRFVEVHQVPLHTFEFQMLYGIRMKLQEELAAEGYTVRCYVPYGRLWFPYFVRRLAERPANVAFLLKSLRKK